jgi:hypothetical protein
MPIFKAAMLEAPVKATLKTNRLRSRSGIYTMGRYDPCQGFPAAARRVGAEKLDLESTSLPPGIQPSTTKPSSLCPGHVLIPSDIVFCVIAAAEYRPALSDRKLGKPVRLSL